MFMSYLRVLCCVVLTVVQLVPLSVVAALRNVVMFRDPVYLYAVLEAHCDTLYRFKGRKVRHFLLRLKTRMGLAVRSVVRAVFNK